MLPAMLGFKSGIVVSHCWTSLDDNNKDPMDRCCLDVHQCWTSERGDSLSRRVSHGYRLSGWSPLSNTKITTLRQTKGVLRAHQRSARDVVPRWRASRVTFEDVR